jgi:hypothetical protein
MRAVRLNPTESIWMYSFVLRRFAILMAFLAVLSLPAGGMAQNPAGIFSVPAEKAVIAPGGVDMRTGRYMYDQADLVIGGQNGALSLKRLMTTTGFGAKAFGNFSSNWDISLTEFRVDANNVDLNGGVGPPLSSGNDYRVFVNAGGLTETFQAFDGSGFQQLSKAGWASLDWAGTHSSAGAIYTFRNTDGSIAVFRPFSTASTTGSSRGTVISTLSEPDGTVYTFDYDTSSGTRLRRVTSNRGYALLLEGSGELTTKACLLNLAQTILPTNNLCPAGVPTASYTYTTLNGPRLASITDAGGATWSFTYSSITGGIQMNFFKPGQGTPWLSNQLGTYFDELNIQQEYVGQQTFANGESYTYNYDFSPNEVGPHAVVGGSFFNALGALTQVQFGFPILPTTAPGNQCTHFPCEFVLLDNIVYQQTSGPVEIVDPLGRVTLNDYCNPNSNRGCFVDILHSYTDPEGNITFPTYDGFRNIVRVRQVAKSGSGLADIVASQTFGCFAGICSKMTSSTDPKGNVANFNYDPVHAGTLSEMKPPPSAGAARPLKLTTWSQKYAYIKNSAGTLVQAASPVFVVATETECQTVAGSNSPVCDNAAPKRTSTYEYGANGTANNLWVKGVGVVASDAPTVTRRTCFGYDTLGRKISTTTPNAGLSSCP